eukprot:Skav202079  [mRNA]  locus=scaffold1138:923300:927762:- [translate_table: standard]
MATQESERPGSRADANTRPGSHGAATTTSLAADCNAGFADWYHGWSEGKKSWCCNHESRGCPGTWGHDHWHHHTVVIQHEIHGVGHGGYDCAAGASNWMQGWSTKKKDWCCNKGHDQYCVKFHCHGEDATLACSVSSEICKEADRWSAMFAVHAPLRQDML